MLSTAISEMFVFLVVPEKVDILFVAVQELASWQSYIFIQDICRWLATDHSWSQIHFSKLTAKEYKFIS